MSSLNEVRLMGNLTADPEVRYTPKGNAICSFSIAINESFLDGAGVRQEEVTFLDVVFFGKRAETIGKFFRKGRPIYVAGRIKVETWDDRESGKKRKGWKIVGQEFIFIGGNNPSSSSSDQGSSSGNDDDDGDERIPF